MNIFCDESGGVGRGVMTLAAVAIAPDAADAVLAEFRQKTGLSGELKGSRIDLDERAGLLAMLDRAGVRAEIGFTVRELRPDPGEDRGDHDRDTYVHLLILAVGALLPEARACPIVTIDDGRYDPATLARIRDEIGTLVGPFGVAQLELSHRSAGLQIADVIANSVFNRALPSARQPYLEAMLRPFFDDGRFALRILPKV